MKNAANLARMLKIIFLQQILDLAHGTPYIWYNCSSSSSSSGRRTDILVSSQLLGLEQGGWWLFGVVIL